MSKVLVCDRCGKKLERTKMFCNITGTAYRYRFNKETYNDIDEYDLCPACEKAFDEFMKGPTEGSTDA